MSNLAQKKPKTIEDFKLEEIDGEILLYSPKATQSIYLNPSASIIWQMCSGEFSTQEIIEALQQQFPENKEAIEADVSETLHKLLEAQAIELL